MKTKKQIIKELLNLNDDQINDGYNIHCLYEDLEEVFNAGNKSKIGGVTMIPKIIHQNNCKVKMAFNEHCTSDKKFFIWDDGIEKWYFIIEED